METTECKVCNGYGGLLPFMPCINCGGTGKVQAIIVTGTNKPTESNNLYRPRCRCICGCTQRIASIGACEKCLQGLHNT